jgi:hypothetical protein
MDIRYLSRRNHELAAKTGTREARQTVDAGQVTRADAAQASTSSSARGAAPASVDTTSRQPSALSRFTPAGRLLRVLEAVEQRHPEETQRVLSNIADKLRSDAEHAGVFSERLTRWADRFQEAADSGDMSKLMPRFSPHFGMRAYQQAEQPDSDATVEHVAGTAETQSNVADSGEPVSGADRASEIRTRPVAVPESESAATERSTSDIRNRPVTVPESAKIAVNH